MDNHNHSKADVVWDKEPDVETGDGEIFWRGTCTHLDGKGNECGQRVYEVYAQQEGLFNE